MEKKGFTPLETIGRQEKDTVSLTGFTLLEILISAIILALVLTGLANIFIAGKKHILHTRSRIQSAELGRLFLAPLQLQVKQSDWGSNCLSTSTGCPGAPPPLDGITYTPTYQTSAFLPDLQNPLGRLRKVKVTITWNEKQ